MNDYITIKLSKRGKKYIGYEAIVSVDDAILDNYRWSYRPPQDNCKVAYASRKTTSNSPMIWLHREVMARKLGRDLLPTELVDHIDGNGLDCRRENLRLATPNENARNTRKRKDNKSGYKGVSARGKRWIAFIVVNRKQIYLGYFDTPELAHAAYCEAVDKYHGEYGSKY